MNLSPLTIRSVRDTMYFRPDAHVAQATDYSAYKRWACSRCSASYRKERDAEVCCPRSADLVYVHPETGEQFDCIGDLADAMAAAGDSLAEFCPVCGSEGRDTHDAANCCLWKDLDVLARMKIANAVEAGATWAEALGVA